MTNTIAIVLAVALFADTLANIARMIGVIAAIRQQERLFGRDSKIKSEQVEAIVKALKEARDE